MDSIPSTTTAAPAPESIPDATYAADPFNHPKADVILRSSDNIYFRVFKLFLSLPSPFFETLFSLPQHPEGSEEQEMKDGLAVIRVTEHSKTLDALLRFCYPCTLAEDPELQVLQDILLILRAAQKYGLTVIEKKVRKTVANPEILKSEPFRCFAIARQGRLREETFLAAKYTLTQPLIPSWFSEIGMITATDLLTLLTYHQKCGDVVYALRADLSWVKAHFQSSQGCAWLSGKHPRGTSISTSTFGGMQTRDDCPCARSPAPKFKVFESYSLQWWEDFMEETFTALRDKPCRMTVERLAEKTIRQVRANGCPICSAHVSEGVRGFSELLVQKVEEAISKINLPLFL